MSPTVDTTVCHVIPAKRKAMTISEIRDLLSAEVLCGGDLSASVEDVGASDLMSDVLNLSKPRMLLLTGLVKPQVIRTAAVVDLSAIVFVRGKKPGREILALAQDTRIPILRTEFTMFEAAGLLYRALKGNQWMAPEGLERRYEICGRDFINAGRASTNIKDTLKSLGVHPAIVRRVAIASYEAEMNVVMYALRGTMTLRVTPEAVTIEVIDEGPGIPDIELAMQEGYSTATPEMCEMGFGAGMGLPNIKKNADEFEVHSEVGRGTQLFIRIRQNT